MRPTHRYPVWRLLYYHGPMKTTLGFRSVLRFRGYLCLLLLFSVGACASKRPAEDKREASAANESESSPAVGEAPNANPAPPAPSAAPASPAAGPSAGDRDHGPVTVELFDPPSGLADGLALKRVARGLKRPVGLEHIPGDTSGRLFIVEQHSAQIRIARPVGEGLDVAKESFFSLRGKVSRANEQGFLGLAFHPQFASNRRLYVNYTARDGTTRVVEYRVDAENGDRVDMASARTVFELDQPFSNHNAGDLEFGPDGKLYIGMGDGGAAGDPLKAGQDRQQLLAKMLRLDVDADADAGAEPEIIQIGLRNPWRYHFDTETGDLYIADVGQNQYEFVYAVAADNLEGHNFGWNIVEGSHCYRSKKCDSSSFTPPIVEYDHRTGCSITGGVVYRGKAIPELVGAYFYADYCTSIIRSLRWSKDGVRQHWRWRKALDPKEKVREISSFGTDAAGEMYVLSLQGDIFKLVRQ